MQYRSLGRSGLRVSAVSFGSWLTLGTTVDDSATERLVTAAFDAGVNLFDTADVYNRGEGELALGRGIAGLRRQHLVLATKCFFPMSDDVNDRGLSRKHINESLHNSLRRLGTDYIDLYQCHRPDPGTPLEETAQAMSDLIRQGKVLYWGTSAWPAAMIDRAVSLCLANGWHAPISNQPRYNLMDREIESEVLPTCEQVGIGQIVYSPLAQGVLTGKYRVGEAPSAGTRAADERANQFVDLSNVRLEQAAQFAELAKQMNQRPAPLALAWCLRQPGVSSVIIGATSTEQLKDNLTAIEVLETLDPDCVAKIEAIFAS